MNTARRNDGLSIIFSIFLGLMVAAFVGIGVYTFHPPPEANPRLEQITSEETEITGVRGGADLSESEQQRLRELSAERTALWEESRAERDAWGRRTSVILITFATLFMAVSLIRADQLPVISNGLLLGGVFTMLYGVGWIVSTETAISRFVVITIALLVTLTLGYFRFVRRQAVAQRPVAVDGGADVMDLERRLRALEERPAAAARALEDQK
jgi:hypothetical protein